MPLAAATQPLEQEERVAAAVPELAIADRRTAVTRRAPVSKAGHLLDCCGSVCTK